ncbi:uncharacterized protein TNCV_138091 [Trichonephila clavipes]|nr:uncharacterized protein TNCV_138091 [Trichonephila clavipes]
MPRTKKFGQVKRRLMRSKTSVNAESERLDVSASKKKIEKSEGSFKDYEDNFSVDTQSSVNEAVIENEHNKNIAIALDGIWQKRGHTSKNGVVTATSLDNGKVIDFECLSKYCFECKSTNKTCDNCQVNYHGFSAGMESEGALRIFSRSLPNYNVRYVQYLGDGDSKGFLRVQESNIYGDEFPVEKLECIGHVQKRMGARLRALKNNLKSTKLSDNKPISGRGRLTDAEILLLQKYYGLAIRRNVGKSVADMSKSIWATYFHKLSTDENPQHALCSMGEESWCGYNKSIVSGEKYTHKHSLPDAVLFKIKKNFRDLTAKELLLKCLHGRTQNPNESFNNCVWNRVPKKLFVSKRTLQMGVMDAVIGFNEGAYARTEVLKALKINPGVNTCEGLRKIDYVRICEAEMAVQKASKEARTTKRQIKRKQGALEQSMQDEYSAGNC